MRHFAACSSKTDIFCAVLHLSAGLWRISKEIPICTWIILLMVSKNPGARVIFSLHSTNLNPGEIIPGLEHANLISITVFYYYYFFASVLLEISQRTKIAPLTIMTCTGSGLHIVKFRLGMKPPLWFGKVLTGSDHLVAVCAVCFLSTSPQYTLLHTKKTHWLMNARAYISS